MKYNFICKRCRVEHELDDLEEVPEEEEHHSYFQCPSCGFDNFTKVPING